MYNFFNKMFDLSRKIHDYVGWEKEAIAEKYNAGIEEAQKLNNANADQFYY